MREIKFRQPIFVNGKFHHWHYWGFIDGAFIGAESGVSSIVEAQRTSQQYTGLKDKNGKEIYEGDIVRDPFYNVVGEVTFQTDVMEDGYGSKMGAGFFPTLDARLEEIEVIGNIYENPELIKQVSYKGVSNGSK